MRALHSAEEGIDLERSLKWFLILLKALFRQSKRGGKAGKGLLSQRMNCLVKGDWGGILTLLEKDTIMLREENRREKLTDKDKGRGEDKEIESKRRNALNLLSKGHISKAVRRINSYGMGDLENPQVREQMRAKYPDRGRPLPPTVSKGQCLDSLKGY